jgi:hypothetical protein
MDDSATESKETKCQTLARMRDKKDVSLVSIGERLLSSYSNRSTGASIPQATYIT